MTYLIPKRLKKDYLIISRPVKVYVKDILFIGIWLMMAWCASGLVFRSLRVAYYMFAALCAIYLTRPARENPGKRKWEAIILFLSRKIANPVYYSVSMPVAPGERKVVHEREIPEA